VWLPTRSMADAISPALINEVLLDERHCVLHQYPTSLVHSPTTDCDSQCRSCRELVLRLGHSTTTLFFADGCPSLARWKYKVSHDQLYCDRSLTTDDRQPDHLTDTALKPMLGLSLNAPITRSIRREINQPCQQVTLTRTAARARLW
jgi:hypothetical protein